jgi:peptidoglycan-associated lipoprotein
MNKGKLTPIVTEITALSKAGSQKALRKRVKMKHFFSLIVCISFIIIPVNLEAQNKSLLKRGDLSFEDKEYYKALMYYQNVKGQKTKTDKFNSKVASCYYFLNDFKNARLYFDKVSNLSEQNKLNYIDVLISEQEYTEAERVYHKLDNKDTPNAQSLFKSIDFHYTSSSKEPKFTVLRQELEVSNFSFGVQYFKSGIVFSASPPNNDAEEHDLNGHPYMDIYYAPKTEDTYGTPVHLGNNINSEFHEGSVCFSKDQKRIYFTRSNSDKLLRIYEAKNNKGHWRVPKALPFNLGEGYSYAHPSLTPDGKSMVLTVSRPDSAIGKDLYISHLRRGEWSTPKKLPAPINLAGDEMFPFIDKDNILYFSSEGRGGYGGLDIYRALPEDSGWGTPELLPEEINSSYDDFGFVLNKDKSEAYLSSNRETQSNKDLIYLVKLNYEYDLASDEKLTSGKEISYGNIYFDFNSANIKAESYPVLESIIYLLEVSPRVSVEIGAHTDSRGSDVYNLKLSQARANSVKKYLEARGIDSSRLTSVGYGETRLINSCRNGVSCSDDEHRKNRRVVFTVK